jgi:hypothetical protein
MVGLELVIFFVILKMNLFGYHEIGMEFKIENNMDFIPCLILISFGIADLERRKKKKKENLCVLLPCLNELITCVLLRCLNNQLRAFPPVAPK